MTTTSKVIDSFVHRLSMYELFDFFLYAMNLFVQDYLCIVEYMMNLRCMMDVHGFARIWLLRYG